MLLDDTDYPKDWPIMHLDRVAKRGSGHTPSKSHPEYWNGNIKWVSLADSYRLDGGYISDTDKKISPEGIKNSSAVIHPPETVILSRDAGVGKSAVTKEAMAVSQHFIAWNCNQTGKVAPWFLYYTLQFHQKELERQAVGSTIKTIGLPFFKNLEIALPPFPEQKKIAAILSTWDRAIEGAEKLLANSQQQKKALMQQLLTGKKRLPGFTGEWAFIALCHVLKEEKTPSVSNPQNVELLTVKLHHKGTIPSGKYPRPSERGRTYHVRHSGTLIIGRQNLHNGGVAIVSDDCDGLIASNAISSFSPRHGYNIKFLYFLMCTNVFMNKVDTLTGGTGQKEVSNKDLFSIKWRMPPLPEQQAIAAVLTTADEEITAIESDLSHLRQEKKALMQQLLTGKRRVTVD